MILFALTILICIVPIAIMIYGTRKHGWTNLYFFSIALVAIALVFAVLGLIR